jgi:biopolymer transport protein ExbD
MVTINARGTVYLDDKPLALPLLEEQVRGRLQGMSMKVAYLRADEALRYGKVIEVVDLLKRAGVDQIGFAYVLPSDRATPR